MIRNRKCWGTRMILLHRQKKPDLWHYVDELYNFLTPRCKLCRCTVTAGWEMRQLHLWIMQLSGWLDAPCPKVKKKTSPEYVLIMKMFQLLMSNHKFIAQPSDWIGVPLWSVTRIIIELTSLISTKELYFSYDLEPILCRAKKNRNLYQ